MQYIDKIKFNLNIKYEYELICVKKNNININATMFYAKVHIKNKMLLIFCSVFTLYN
jgi:hypothetical protein